MTAPLDLCAVEARLRLPKVQKHSAPVGAWHDARALLAHCRALRAALQNVLEDLGEPTQLESVWDRAAAVLAQATDEPDNHHWTDAQNEVPRVEWTRTGTVHAVYGAADGPGGLHGFYTFCNREIRGDTGTSSNAWHEVRKPVTCKICRRRQ